ncbi:hypothetical protein T484DRAFT_1815483 [Baffinella frigidus]|nr:hypothetical protein T484DRAFT_1815483 [Cryptophyta sp. CCMP2293]
MARGLDDAATAEFPIRLEEALAEAAGGWLEEAWVSVRLGAAFPVTDEEEFPGRRRSPEEAVFWSSPEDALDGTLAEDGTGWPASLEEAGVDNPAAGLSTPSGLARVARAGLPGMLEEEFPGTIEEVGGMLDAAGLTTPSGRAGLAGVAGGGGGSTLTEGVGWLEEAAGLTAPSVLGRVERAGGDSTLPDAGGCVEEVSPGTLGGGFPGMIDEAGGLSMRTEARGGARATRGGGGITRGGGIMMLPGRALEAEAAGGWLAEEEAEVEFLRGAVRGALKPSPGHIGLRRDFE